MNTPSDREVVLRTRVVEELMACESNLASGWEAEDEAAERTRLEARQHMELVYETLRAIDSVVLDHSLRFERGNAQMEVVGSLDKGITLDPLRFSERIVKLAKAIKRWPTYARYDTKPIEPAGRAGQLAGLLFKMARAGQEPQAIAAAFSRRRGGLKGADVQNREGGILRFFAGFLRYRDLLNAPSHVARFESVREWEAEIDRRIAAEKEAPEPTGVITGHGGDDDSDADSPAAQGALGEDSREKQFPAGPTAGAARTSPPPSWRHPIESIAAVIEVLDAPDHKRCGWKKALVALIDLAHEDPTAKRWQLTARELFDRKYSRIADLPNRVGRVRTMMVTNVPDLATWIGLDTAPTLSAIYLRAKEGAIT